MMYDSEGIYIIYRETVMYQGKPTPRAPVLYGASSKWPGSVKTKYHRHKRGNNTQTSE